MFTCRDFPHAVVDGFDVVKMNYQSGELSMVIVVPTRGNEDPDELSESAVLDVLTSSEYVCPKFWCRLVENVPVVFDLHAIRFLALRNP